MIDNTTPLLSSPVEVKKSLLPFSNAARSEFGELCRQIDELNKTVQRLRTDLEDEERNAYPWCNHRWTTGECVINSIGFPLGFVGLSSAIVGMFLQSYPAIFGSLFAGGIGTATVGLCPLALAYYDGGICGLREKSEGFSRRFHKLNTIDGNLNKAVEQINTLVEFKFTLEEWKKEPTDEEVQSLFKLEDKMIETLKNWDKSSLQEDRFYTRGKAPQKFIDEMKRKLPHEACKLALMDELSIALPSAKFAQEWQELMDTSSRSFKWINVDCQPWQDLKIVNPKKSVYDAYFTHQQRADSVLMLSKQIAIFVAKQEVAEL